MKNILLIINYNDFTTTKKLIDNVKDYKVLDEIVVVDNNSTDNSFNELKKLNITLLKNEKNGYGAGINYGSKYLIEKYGKCNIIVSNPDVVIYSEDDLKKLINSFDSDIIAPVIKEHDGLNRGWKIPTPLEDVLLNLPLIHKFLRKKLLFYKDSYYDGVVEVEAVSGCFFIINSDSLKKANYFDEEVFLYYEENIISRKINGKIKINSDIEVFHNHSITIDKNINRIKKYKILKKSQYYFQKKYNKANVFELFFLLLTNKLTLCLLYIRSLFVK